MSCNLAILLALVVSLAAPRASVLILGALEEAVGCVLRRLDESVGEVGRLARLWWLGQFGDLPVRRATGEAVVAAGAGLVCWADWSLQTATFQADVFGLDLAVGTATASALTLTHVIAGALVAEAMQRRPVIRTFDGLQGRSRVAVVVGGVLVFLLGAFIAAAAAAVRAYLAAEMTAVEGGPQDLEMVRITAGLFFGLSALVATLAAVAGAGVPRLVGDVAGIALGVPVSLLLVCAWAARSLRVFWERVWDVPQLVLAAVHEIARKIATGFLWVALELRLAWRTWSKLRLGVPRSAEGGPGCLPAPRESATDDERGEDDEEDHREASDHRAAGRDA